MENKKIEELLAWGKKGVWRLDALAYVEWNINDSVNRTHEDYLYAVYVKAKKELYKMNENQINKLYDKLFERNQIFIEKKRIQDYKNSHCMSYRDADNLFNSYNRAKYFEGE